MGEQSESNANERTFIHDILNPFTVINANLEFLKKGLDPHSDKLEPKVFERLEKISNNLKKMESLILERRNLLKSQE